MKSDTVKNLKVRIKKKESTRLVSPTLIAPERPPMTLCHSMFAVTDFEGLSPMQPIYL